MNKLFLVGGGGLLIGAVLSGLVFSKKNSSQTISSTATPSPTLHHDMSSMGTTMTNTVNELKGKTGDDFDKAFISEMIEHHQGAIDMAKLVALNAKHSELKKMAEDIISAQSREIEMMQQWQKMWGY